MQDIYKLQYIYSNRGHLKRVGSRAGNRFGLVAKWTCPFKWAGGHKLSGLLVAELCALAVVMLDTQCFEVV